MEQAKRPRTPEVYDIEREVRQLASQITLRALILAKESGDPSVGATVVRRVSEVLADAADLVGETSFEVGFGLDAG